MDIDTLCKWTPEECRALCERHGHTSMRGHADCVAAARADERAKVLAKIEAIVAAPAPVAWSLLHKLRVYLRGDKP